MIKSFLTCKIFILTALLCVVSYKSYAQLAIIEDQPLSFGTFTFVDMADVLEINIGPTGNIINTANTVLITAPTNGEYTITGGNPGQVYNATAESSTTLTGDGPGTFTLDNIVVSPETGSFDGFGETQINVGGRLRSQGGNAQYKNDTYSQNTTITISY